jgi:hypothetical protein
MTFREITIKDVPALFDVRTSVRENTYTSEGLYRDGITEKAVAEIIGSTHCGWLCEIDSKIVGFTMANGSTGEFRSSNDGSCSPRLLKKTPDNIRFSEELRGNREELLQVARQFQLEGLIAKRPDSVYEPSRRSSAWVKSPAHPAAGVRHWQLRQSVCQP